MYTDRNRKSLSERVQLLTAVLQNSRLDDYVAYLEDTRRMLRKSFLAGLARGLGMAIGFSVLGAVVLIVLRNLANHNVPWLSEFLLPLVEAIERAGN